MKFRISIKNYTGFEFYNKVKEAKDENDALKQVLNDVDIACGDKIDMDYE